MERVGSFLGFLSGLTMSMVTPYTKLGKQEEEKYIGERICPALSVLSLRWLLIIYETK